MICAEVTIYPLKHNNPESVINNSIRVLQNENVDYKVGSISTHLHGREEDVWRSLKEMFDTAQEAGEVNMVVTISNAAD
ncbi:MULTISPECIES: YkoF family thiamine/hydroxymethylpyrimidine-binding protein [Caloramator]|uniref:Thiamine-binding protein domain-containing protein n=1 Tax=Caloramator australicus RC3 TaxID=857293 RepID=G0V463_9CLOT|nr:MULTISPECIES: YkoF family thiamine/hydroxymethylpyrimidine-binding protein [Caloramator]MCX7904496.1 thiamine-binding protein [Caloramator sp.]MDO6354962.1 YkoF family thiamine/hydroxymethylpyrimidine-binding protein [Caloramator sp. CAR-1]CCC57903.1 hypothetical protein CAAU_0254 [Caloramator australicus RC3]